MTSFTNTSKVAKEQLYFGRTVSIASVISMFLLSFLLLYIISINYNICVVRLAFETYLVSLNAGFMKTH